MAAAGVLLAVIKILSPFAQEYGRKYFEIAPMYLLQYVFRPFALVLLGWGIAEAGKAFDVIRIWEGRPQRWIRIARILFYVSVVILAVFAVLVLWTAVDLTYLWLMSERMMKQQGSFDSSTVPRLMPGQLQRIAMRVIVRSHLGDGGLFLGALPGLCRMKKENPGETAQRGGD